MVLFSKRRFGFIGGRNEEYEKQGINLYTGLNGQLDSYYAMPMECRNLEGLAPMMIVVAEYDPLRDEGLQYAMRLLSEGVPCEILCAPRVSHGFCAVDAPLTQWVHNGICASFRREFGMDIVTF